jgi:hypothetical protein
MCPAASQAAGPFERNGSAGSIRGSARARSSVWRMLVGAVGRGWQDSAMNHPVDGPDRHVDLVHARAPHRSLRCQDSEFERRAGREVRDSTADFLQGMARKLLVLDSNPRVRKEGYRLEWASSLRERKEAKAAG